MLLLTKIPHKLINGFINLFVIFGHASLFMFDLHHLAAFILFHRVFNKLIQNLSQPIVLLPLEPVSHDLLILLGVLALLPPLGRNRLRDFALDLRPSLL